MLEGRARNADGTRSHLRARRLEEVERDDESLSLLADEPIDRHARVVEDERARVRSAEPELPFLATGSGAWVVALDEERGHRPVELREHDRDLGDAAVRHVDLLAIQDVRVAVALRLGADRCEIGSRVRLGESDRGERAFLAREQRQIAVALRVRAEPEQRPHREHRRLDRRGEPCAAPRQLLRDQRGRDRVGAAAAVLRGNRVRREADARRLREQVGWKVLALVPLGSDRPQLALRELVREPLELTLLVCQIKGDHAQ